MTEVMCRKCASYCECKIDKGYEMQNMDPGLILCYRARMANFSSWARLRSIRFLQMPEIAYLLGPCAVGWVSRLQKKYILF